MKNPAYFRVVSRLAKERGWALAHTSGGHLRLTHPSGAVVITASSPRSERCIKHTLAAMRRVEREHA
jgi:predicted RNA binding protein YcfA (HicA-like mRNA interferase family)